MKAKTAALVLILVCMLLANTAAPAYAMPNSAYQSVWRNINASCKYGAQVGISASGQVTATFYRTYLWWTVTETKVANFGAGQSKTISTGTSGSYQGVSVSGYLQSVGSAGCR